MDIKEISPLTIFYYETEATIPSLGNLAQEINPQLMQKVEELGLQIQGSLLYVYYGMDGKPETKFRVQMALPVAESKSDQGNFKFRTTEAFRCATTIHEGAWSKFGDTYEKLIGEIMQGGHQMTQEIREIYHVMQAPESSENQTEIQVGLAS